MKFPCFCASILCLATSLFPYPTDWSPGAEIPSGGTYANTNVTLAYNAFSKRMFAAWNDGNTSQGYYSIFNGSVWSAAAAFPMGMSADIYESIFQTYNAGSHQMFAGWANQTAPRHPWFTIYDGSSWTTAAQIPQGMSGNVDSNVRLAYDSGSNQVVATWSDGDPYAAYHDGTGWILTEPINLGTSSGSWYDVAVCYNFADDEIFVAWINTFNDSPYYSRRVGGMWTSALIPQGVSGGAYYNVNLAYDSIGNRVFAVWADINNQRVFYSIYSGGSWSTAVLINHGPSAGAVLDAYLAFDPDSNAMYVTWADVNTGLPYYSVYSGGAWSTGAVIPPGVSPYAGNNVFSAYNSGQFALFAAWDDGITGFPIWSSTSLTPLPPEGTPPNFLRPSNRRPIGSLNN